LKAFRLEHDVCSVTLLPSSREALLRLFSDRQRANLRNAQSRLRRAGGGEVQLATDETLCEFLEDLFVLHTSRWSTLGEPGVLAGEQVRRFHLLASPRLLRSGQLCLYRLRVNGRTAAVIYALLARQTVYCYLQGFNPELSFFSPGTLLMFSVMEDAVRRGMRRFDLLRGQETYKRHWRPQAEPTFRVAVPRARLVKLLAEHVQAA
jgi:CelD/BcsL family acetyltransferase involved in cellulose biosynthesis